MPQNKVLVTGGGGFLGGAIVRRLVERGAQVTSISRRPYDSLVALGVRQIQGDISDGAAVDRAVQGMHTVYHVAAKAGVWGPYEAYYQANVVGTRNVIEACRKHGTSKLIYTSSPSVVFDGTDQSNWDESAPYPKTFLAHYPRTKAEAERLVIEANDASLATVSLRPHLIWGPGDNHLVPRIIQRGRAGKIAVIGDPKKLVDSVYIDNAAEAHLQAADHLEPGGRVAGKNYFITNDEPMPMVSLINGILKAAGIDEVRKRAPAPLVYFLGALMERCYQLLGKQEEPALTRFVAKQLATAHYYDISAAKRDFGYRPQVSIEEGLQRLADSLRQNPL